VRCTRQQNRVAAIDSPQNRDERERRGVRANHPRVQQLEDQTLAESAGPTFEVCVRNDCCCELSHRVANVDSAAKSTKQPIELRNRQFDGSADSCDRQNRDRRVDLFGGAAKNRLAADQTLGKDRVCGQIANHRVRWNVSCCSELLRDDRVANAVARRPFALVWRHAPDWRRRQASKSASEKPVQKCC